MGAVLIGRMILKNVRHGPAPSREADSSISRLIPRKNCRRKKIAKRGHQERGQDHAGQGVQQAQILDQDEVGQAGEDRRHEQSAEEEAEHDLASRPAETGKGIGGHRAEEHLAERHRPGIDHRVAQVEPEAHRGPGPAFCDRLFLGAQPKDALEGAPGEVHRQQGRRVGRQRTSGGEGGADHPQERDDGQQEEENHHHPRPDSTRREIAAAAPLFGVRKCKGFNCCHSRAPYARSDSPARSRRSWTAARMARMTKRITERALP